MKFLKVFVNSLITGMFFGSLLALLVYDVNINLEVDILFFGQLTLFLTMIYGVAVLVLSVLFYFILQFILGRSFRIAFFSPSFLILSFSLMICFFLLLFRANFHYFLSFFDPETQSLLNKQFLTLGFLALLGLVCFYGFNRYRKSVIFPLVYFLLFFAAAYYVFLQRMNFPVLHQPKRVANLEAKAINKKVTIIGLDGLSFDVMIPLINEEKLPNFSWLMNEGSWGTLENDSPTEPLIQNTSFSSGKLPAKHRQLSLYKYRMLHFTRELEVVPRYIFFWQLLHLGLLEQSLNDISFSQKDIWAILKDNKANYLVRDWPYYQDTISPSQKAETRFNLIFNDLKSDNSEIFQKVKRAFYSDFEYEEKIMEMRADPQLQIVYFMLNGLNTVEQFFYKYSFPDLFGNIEQDEISRYSSVIERYYQFYDDVIGKYLASRKENELLIVFSPHGIEPLPLWKRVQEWLLGDPNISAYHELAPDGVVFFHGREIWRGKNIEPMRLIDIAPTLLNYLGLPIGKDMDGIVFSSIFRDEFKLENPVLYISSYEEHAIKQPD